MSIAWCSERRPIFPFVYVVQSKSESILAVELFQGEVVGESSESHVWEDTISLF